jgi:hypothetical protein
MAHKQLVNDGPDYDKLATRKKGDTFKSLGRKAVFVGKKIGTRAVAAGKAGIAKGKELTDKEHREGYKKKIRTTAKTVKKYGNEVKKLRAKNQRKKAHGTRRKVGKTTKRRSRR